MRFRTTSSNNYEECLCDNDTDLTNIPEYIHAA